MSKTSQPRITAAQARSFILERQGLSSQLSTPIDIARRLVAIQSQYLTSVPHAVCSRSRSSSQAEVNAAIEHEHSLVRTWCLRGTVHTLAAVDLPLVVGAYGARRRTRHAAAMHKYYGISAKQLAALERGIVKALGNGPVTRKELKRRVKEYANVRGAGYGMDVAGLAGEGTVLFAPSIKGDTAFVLREQWLPQLKWQVPSADEARLELARRYFAAYGPASWQDFIHWSGFKVSMMQGIREEVERELVELEVIGWPAPQFIIQRDLAALAATEPRRPKVRLLPKFDSLTLGYRHKVRWIDEDQLSQVYRIAAQVEAVVLVNGRMAGTWRIKPGRKLSASIEPFAPLSKTAAEQVKREFNRLGKFLDGRKVELR